MPLYLGIGEKAVFAVYGLVALVWVALGHRQLRDSAYLVLMVAGVCLAGSLIIDQIPLPIPQVHFFEDGGKFAGIMGWAAYFVVTAHEHVTQSSKLET